MARFTAGGQTAAPILEGFIGLHPTGAIGGWPEIVEGVLSVERMTELIAQAAQECPHCGGLPCTTPTEHTEAHQTHARRYVSVQVEAYQICGSIPPAQRPGRLAELGSKYARSADPSSQDVLTPVEYALLQFLSHAVAGGGEPGEMPSANLEGSSEPNATTARAFFKALDSKAAGLHKALRASKRGTKLLAPSQLPKEAKAPVGSQALKQQAKESRAKDRKDKDKAGGGKGAPGGAGGEGVGEPQQGATRMDASGSGAGGAAH